MKTMPKGLLVVLSGPSGAGKGTVCQLLRQRNPHLAYSVSATTRSPRPGEKHGVNYFFLKREEFEAWRDRGEFLEWAEFCGNLYGTPRSYVEERLASGQDVLLEIETQGALQIRASFPTGVFIFLLPPSWAELKARIIQRGTESEEERRRRLAKAESEIAMLRAYDYLVINDRVEQAVARVEAILMAEHARVNRFSDEELKAQLEGQLL
ncbi:MAG: guanylate kinase [Bacillota bacterium]|nr:guanylate kinase [Bacillota bacterium]MDK2882000.1 guanylate kinase [Bacillota bacterium]MDK2960025.1 guanylate kinase [Bacillota bacterium]